MLGLLVETLESNFEFESMIKLGFDWDKCDLMMNMTIWLILIYLLMLMNKRSMLRLEEDQSKLSFGDFQDDLLLILDVS